MSVPSCWAGWELSLIYSTSVNVILVVGHEKLNVEMQRTYGNRMAVVKIPKSGGVCPCVFNMGQFRSILRAGR